MCRTYVDKISYDLILLALKQTNENTMMMDKLNIYTTF